MAKSKKIVIWGKSGRNELVDNELFTGISFVDKARLKDSELNRGLSYIYFDYPNLVAMDGHRLHLYVVDIEDLFFNKHCYEVIKISSSEIHLGNIGQMSSDFYPGWRHAWPDGLYQSIDGTVTVTKANLSEAYSNVIRHMLDDKILDFGFFKDLTPMEYCDVGFWGEQGFVIFKAGKFGAALVPKGLGN